MTKEEFKACERAKQMHGDKYTYLPAPGVTPNLKDLRKGQRVCAGGKDFHIVMTPIEDSYTHENP